MSCQGRITTLRIWTACITGFPPSDIMQGAAQQGLRVEVEKDPGGHDRWISTDTGWRINLGRGLDIFQKSEGGWFDLGTSRQEFRQVKAFGVTYVREA